MAHWPFKRMSFFFFISLIQRKMSRHAHQEAMGQQHLSEEEALEQHLFIRSFKGGLNTGSSERGVATCQLEACELHVTGSISGPHPWLCCLRGKMKKSKIIIIISVIITMLVKQICLIKLLNDSRVWACFRRRGGSSSFG